MTCQIDTPVFINCGNFYESIQFSIYTIWVSLVGFLRARNWLVMLFFHINARLNLYMTCQIATQIFELWEYLRKFTIYNIYIYIYIIWATLVGFLVAKIDWWCFFSQNCFNKIVLCVELHAYFSDLWFLVVSILPIWAYQVWF